MIALLTAKEIRALLRDGRLLALGLAVLVLSIGVLWTSHLDGERRRVEKRDLTHATREQWDSQGEKHPHRGAHFGLYVFAPESPLAAFDPGVHAHFGESIYLEPHRRNLSRLSTVQDDLLYGRLGELTPAFVLVSILPLLIVAALHGSVAGERESGILRMLRSTGAQMSTIVWSKAAAVIIAAGLIIAAVFGVLLMLSGEAIRSGLLALTYLAYCLVFVAIGLAVSVWSRTSRQALVALVAIWLGVTWIVPRAGATLAAAIVPLPSADAFWKDIRRDYQQGLPGDGDLATRSRLFDEQLLATHKVTKLEDLPFGAYAIRRLNRDRYADEVHQLHFEHLWQRFHRQEEVLRWAAVLSPAVAVRHISMKLAGTDLQHRKSFEDAAEQYRQRFNTQIDRWDAEATVGLRSFEDKYGNDELWRAIEPFEYRAPNAARAVMSALPELGTLAVWTVAALALLAVASRKVSL